MIKNIIFVYEYVMFYESKNTSIIVKQDELNFFDDRTQHSNPLPLSNSGIFVIYNPLITMFTYTQD